MTKQSSRLNCEFYISAYNPGWEPQPMVSEIVLVNQSHRMPTLIIPLTRADVQWSGEITSEKLGIQGTYGHGIWTKGIPCQADLPPSGVRHQVTCVSNTMNNTWLTVKSSQSADYGWIIVFMYFVSKILHPLYGKPSTKMVATRWTDTNSGSFRVTSEFRWLYPKPWSARRRAGSQASKVAA